MMDTAPVVRPTFYSYYEHDGASRQTSASSSSSSVATTISIRKRRQRKCRDLLPLASLVVVVVVLPLFCWRLLRQEFTIHDVYSSASLSFTKIMKDHPTSDSGTVKSYINDSNIHYDNGVTDIMEEEEEVKDVDECCAVMCTTPPNVCCLSCTYLSSPREHDLLMAMMEGLTVHLMDKHAPHPPTAANAASSSSAAAAAAIEAASTNQHNAWLHTRAWEGNSHIGNRPEQATFYYDWMRSIDGGGSNGSREGQGGGGRVQHVCEIGMNGGHSALIFLAALSKTNAATVTTTTTSRIRGGGEEEDTTNKRDDNTAKLTMFDRYEFDYSPSAKSYIEKLYPGGRLELHKGDSTITVPKWTLAMEEGVRVVADDDDDDERNTKCDVFSVDGDHSYDGAKIDILNAIRATNKGGKIILDDMNPGGPTRRAFDDILSRGQNETNVEGTLYDHDDVVVLLADPRCVEDVYIRVGYEDRINGTNAREMYLSWCSATVV